MEPVLALETMKEGHDGSGLGLTLKDLGGEFEELKEISRSCPGSARKNGVKVLDDYHDKAGFKLKVRLDAKDKTRQGDYRRVTIILRVSYDYPESYRDKPMQEKEDLLMQYAACPEKAR